jgi:hypothetical protein
VTAKDKFDRFFFFFAGQAGYFPIHPMSYITAERNRKKAAQEAEQKAAEQQAEEKEEKAAAT